MLTVWLITRFECRHTHRLSTEITACMGIRERDTGLNARGGTEASIGVRRKVNDRLVDRGKGWAAHRFLRIVFVFCCS
jgi:hypothetical protein